jgi:hypothetical protein
MTLTIIRQNAVRAGKDLVLTRRAAPAEQGIEDNAAQSRATLPDAFGLILSPLRLPVSPPGHIEKNDLLRFDKLTILRYAGFYDCPAHIQRRKPFEC